MCDYGRGDEGDEGEEGEAGEEEKWDEVQKSVSKREVNKSRG